MFMFFLRSSIFYFCIDKATKESDQIDADKDDIYIQPPNLYRNERPGLVASLEQYIMVYDLLQHHLLRGTTSRSVWY
jgi:hypothetical protein